MITMTGPKGEELVLVKDADCPSCWVKRNNLQGEVMYCRDTQYSCNPEAEEHKDRGGCIWLEKVEYVTYRLNGELPEKE